GTYGSPQLLLLSGLGPAQHLQEMGVEVVRDMPAVGSNLHDHFTTSTSWRCTRDHPERLGKLLAAQNHCRHSLRPVSFWPDGEQRRPCRRVQPFRSPAGTTGPANPHL